MAVIIGSARIDERGQISGGKAGDQTTKEVSTQAYYVHSKGWVLLRPKKPAIANKIAKAMLDACNNDNIGYDQSQRETIVPLFKEKGAIAKIDTKCECDCSKLVQICVWEATGKDPGNFTTGYAVSTLSKTGFFETPVDVTSKTVICKGDILCTKTKGHIVIVTSGDPRPTSNGQTTSDKTTNESTHESWYTTCSLYIRQGAGVHQKALSVLPPNTDCVVHEKKHMVEGTEWFKVTAKGITGFVSSKYLDKK